MTRANPLHMLLDNFQLLLLCFCLILPLLPFHLIYKENISIVLAIISFGLFIHCLQLFQARDKQVNNLLIVGLLFVYLVYILIQIIPVPSWLMNLFSPLREQIWRSGAYGLNGYATLSLDISATIWFAILLICYFSIFILTNNLVVTQKRLMFLVMIVFLLGIYQIVFDLLSKSLGYQYVSASETDGHSYRLTGTFINSNNLSALLNLSFAAGLALLMMLFDRFKSGKKFLILLQILLVIGGLLLLLYGSIQSGSIGGLLSLLLAVGLIGTILLCKRLDVKGLLLFLGFFVCVISLLVFYGSRELNIEQLTQKLTLSGRTELWLAVIDMWQDFPLFGIGGGAFEWSFPAYKTDNLSPLRIINAHSSYINLLAETGLIGVFILAAIIYIYLKSVIRLIKNKPGLMYIMGSLMIGWIAFMTHEAVENNLLLPAVAAPFFCLMALVLCVGKIDFNKGGSN